MEPETAEPPLRCLRAAFRTEDRLSHRDILGSLMGMGIVREKVGDILVSPESADLIVLDTVADFLLSSWNSAGRARLTVTVTVSGLSRSAGNGTRPGNRTGHRHVLRRLHCFGL
mgnify:CR=1 FL=1